MAIPTDAAQATYDGSSSTTSHSVTLPGSISSGDMLVMALRTPSNVGINTPSGWTTLGYSTADASDDQQSIIYRVADGTEGATQTVTLTSAARLCAITWRITGTATLGAHVDTQPSPSTGGWVIGGSTTTPDGGYSSAYSVDTLFLSIVGISSGAHTISSAPTGYTNATQINNTGATGSGQCTLVGASKGVSGSGLPGSTEDPGTWTLNSGNVYMAMTVAISTEPATARLTAEPVQVAVLGDAPTVRLTALPVQVAYDPIPPIRVTHAPVEAPLTDTNPNVRVTHQPVEVLSTESTDVNVRVTSAPVEVVVAIQIPIRVSQMPVEAVVAPSDTKARVSQMPVEAIVAPSDGKIRLSQMPVEVLVEVVSVTGQGFFAYVID